MSPAGDLYVSAPTLASYDSVRRIDPEGRGEALNIPFGRPQGLAFDPNGVLHVVEALAGSSGVYAIRPDRDPELIVAGAGLVGARVRSRGEMVVASSDSVYLVSVRLMTASSSSACCSRWQRCRSAFAPRRS